MVLQGEQGIGRLTLLNGIAIAAARNAGHNPANGGI